MFRVTVFAAIHGSSDDVYLGWYLTKEEAQADQDSLWFIEVETYEGSFNHQLALNPRAKWDGSPP